MSGLEPDLDLVQMRAGERGPTHWVVYESPFGPLTLLGGARGLRAVRFPGRGEPLDEADRQAGPFAEALRQFEQYFAGERRRFELPLDLDGTALQRQVWDELARIPCPTATPAGRHSRPPR